MGGGNAQKSAMARQRNQEKAQASKVSTFIFDFKDYSKKNRYWQNSGGGAKGKEARSGGNMAEAMAAAAAKREEVKKKREEKNK